MANNRTLQTSFWNDRRVAALLPTYRYLLLYLKTNKYIQVSGCCKLKVLQIVLETGLEQEEVRAGLVQLETAGFIKYADDWLAVAGEMQNKGTKLQAAVDLQLEMAPSWVSEFLVQGKVADDRVNHPAIQAVRDALQRYPQKNHWDALIECIGDEPDINYLTTCYQEWAKRGYNPNGLAWVFQWYVERRIPGISKYGTGSNADTLREYYEAGLLGPG